MKAVFFEKPGLENVRYGDFPDPTPGPGEALLRVRYAGVNPIDRAVAMGAAKASPIPHVLGCEFVGEVLEPGDSGLSRGDPVVVYNRLYCGRCGQCLTGETQLCEVQGQIVGAQTQGGWAELAVVPGRNLVRTRAPLDQAVGLPIGGLTAYNMLRRAGVRTGIRVAVVGATGNVGVFAVQLAKLAGAYVAAVTRRADRFVTELKRLGADEVVRPEELPRLAQQLGGFHVVVDPLGSATFELSLSVLARNGVYVTAGALTGAEARLDLRRLYGGQYSVVGSTGGRRADLELLVGLMERGLIRTPVAMRLPLSEAAKALAGLDSPDRLGKLVLEV